MAYLCVFQFVMIFFLILLLPALELSSLRVKTRLGRHHPRLGAGPARRSKFVEEVGVQYRKSRGLYIRKPGFAPRPCHLLTRPLHVVPAGAAALLARPKARGGAWRPRQS